jgi:amidohydrolase
VTSVLVSHENPASAGDETTTAVAARIYVALEQELIAVRRDIHAHPELSGSEIRTTALVAKRLRAAGLRPRLLPGRTGLVCDIGRGERTIALRADLDALPLADPKDVPYRSTVDGVCHACGHDVHTTILLGAGLVLAELNRRGQLPGRVRLLFQPSEEKVPFGSLRVIEAGGLHEVDAIFALHCNPQLEAGTIGVREGVFTAAADLVDVQLTGPGGHTARPHLTVDLVHALGTVVASVPAILKHRIGQRANVSMVFGTINAGVAANAIPSVGTASATVRSLWPQRDRLPGIIEEIVCAAVKDTGAEAMVDYVHGVPPVVNDANATSVVADAGARVLGSGRVVAAELSMGAEDFSFYLGHVPGAMFRLGTRRPGQMEIMDIHHPRFDVDEAAVGVGVRVFVETALGALSESRLRPGG